MQNCRRKFFTKYESFLPQAAQDEKISLNKQTKAAHLQANFILQNYSNELGWKFKAPIGVRNSKGSLLLSNQTRIISGVMFNYLTERMPNWIKQAAIGSILSFLVYSFKLFHPLAYGFADASTERNSTMFGLRWLESWEF